MEGRPNPEQEPTPIVRFNMEDGEYEATPQNALVFLHSEEADKEYDHVFIFKDDIPEDKDWERLDEEDEEATLEGWFIWRRNAPEFEKAVQFMRDRGFTVIELEHVSDGDMEAYTRAFGNPENTIQTYELTPRQEVRTNFLKHLLDRDLLVPDDFKGDGDLFI
jgi:hypothetical protein